MQAAGEQGGDQERRRAGRQHHGGDLRLQGAQRAGQPQHQLRPRPAGQVLLCVLCTVNYPVLFSTGASVASLGSGLPATPRTIRPLTQAYKEAQADNAVVPNTNTPVKSSGFVSKAMEYMFGW